MARVVTFESVPSGLRARIDAAGVKLPTQLVLAVLIDGAYAGETTGRASRRRTSMELDIVLTRHSVGENLDLIEIETGRSILAKPYPLSSFHKFETAGFSVSKGVIHGGFTMHGLGNRLLVEFWHEDQLMARGFASRADGAETSNYRFRLAVLSTIKPFLPVQLLPRIAGQYFPEASIWASAADVGFVGFVDHVALGQISGWAINLDSPLERLAVDLIMDDAVIDTVVAEQPRDDLRVAGLGDGFSAFTFSLKPSHDFQSPRQVSVVVSGTRMELQGSPTDAIPAPPIQGFFDRLHGWSAHGWVINNLNPKTPVVVEAVCEGRVLASAEGKLFRGDLLDAGLNGGFCAFKIDIGSQSLALLGKPIFIRVAGTDLNLAGSPRILTQNPNRLRYLRQDRGVSPTTLPRLKRALNHRVGQQRLSIIMPVYNTPREWLVECLNSVLGQWCDNWELICVDDCSTESDVSEILLACSRHDSRVRVLRSSQNVGIARATNLALRAARNAYVTFLDHDDYLEPDAVYHLLRAAKMTGADFIYSDEATTDEKINSIDEVKARPAFSYDYYLSHPYFVHMLCMRRDLAYRVGGWDERMTISADVDFVLRLLETEPLVTHVPRVLYRWRTHGGSTGHSKKEMVMEATRGAIQRHLDRRNTGATVEDGVWFNQFRVNWPLSKGRILIVIPTKNKTDLVKTVVESVERTSTGVDYRIVVVDHESDDPASRAYLDDLAERHTVMPYEGPFNYSRMNNLAVAAHGDGCEFVLFLNNDVEALHDGWLDRMRSLANRKEVGAVGALLLYPDKRVQHAGVIIGFNGSAEATFKFEAAYTNDRGDRNLGYNCSMTSVRDYSAVTAACLMMRKNVFQSIGGFDELLKIGFNDVDICLRAREAGYKVLYDGDSVLFHYESATRSQTNEVMHPEDTSRFLARHTAIFVKGDPFYNPNLSYVSQDHVLREDAGCKSFRDRVTPFSVLLPVLPVPGAPEQLKPARPKRRIQRRSAMPEKQKA